MDVQVQESIPTEDVSDVRTNVETTNFKLVSRDSCDVCGSDKYESIHSASYSSEKLEGFLRSYYKGEIPNAFFDAVELESYDVCKCQKCSFVWQRNVLNDESCFLLYEKWINSELSFLKTVGPKSFQKAERFSSQMAPIKKYFGKNSNEIRVLDFGCGWGKWLEVARCFGFQTVGVELSESRRNHANGIGLSVFESIESISSEKFDVINLNQVLEHIQFPKPLIKQLLELLEDDGIIRIAVPNAQKAIKEVQSEGWNPKNGELHPLEHINAFTNSTLKEMCVQLDLEPVLMFDDVTHHPIKCAKEIAKFFLSTDLTFKKRKTNIDLIQSNQGHLNTTMEDKR